MNNDLKKIEWVTLSVIFSGLFLASLYVVKPLFDAVIFSAFFAYITSPLATRFEGILKNRSLSASLVVVLTILPLVLIIWQLLNIYSNEFYRLGEIRFSTPYLREVDWNAMYVSAVSEAQKRMSPEKVLQGIGVGLELVLKGFIIIVGAFFMLRERVELKKFIISLAPSSKQCIVATFLETADKMFYGLFIGHLITSLTVGFISSIGFYLIGRFMGIDFLISYPVFFGTLIAIATLLPVIGAWLIYVPVSTALFLMGDIFEAAVVLVFGVLILSLIPDLVIRPYISGKKGKTHPFVVLLGFICGPIVFGPVGLIIGPAILGLFKATIDTYKDLIGGGNDKKADREGAKTT